MELGLQTLAAGGALMVGTLQGGKREVSRFEAERDEAGNMTDQPAFDAYLRGVRKTGASHPRTQENCVRWHSMVTRQSTFAKSSEKRT